MQSARSGSTRPPFRFNASDEALADLRRRVAATKWPSQELVTDASQGVQRAAMRELARYWQTEYDWRKFETRLNALPQFMTTIDGVDIHFIHVRSKNPNALPVIVTHGWPGSIIEELKVVDPLTNPPPSGLSADEKYAYDQLDFFYQYGLGYAQEMHNHPQTLYGIEDSPIGLAAWMIDHDVRSYELIARVFAGQPEGLTRDDILDNVTLYWLTNTAVSSARLYWESNLPFFAPKGITIPVAVSAFPDDIYMAPRSWTEKAYPRLIHYNRLPKGGHFAAWEQPQAFSEELRASFRSLRQPA